MNKILFILFFLSLSKINAGADFNLFKKGRLEGFEVGDVDSVIGINPLFRSYARIPINDFRELNFTEMLESLIEKFNNDESYPDYFRERIIRVLEILIKINMKLMVG